MCRPIAPGVTVEQFGSSGSDILWDLEPGGAGEMLAAGQAGGVIDGQPFAGGSDAFLTSRNTTSAKSWTRLWGSPEAENVKGMVRVASGEIIATGLASAPLENGEPEGELPFIRKLSETGERLSTRRWGTGGQVWPYAIAQDGQGNLVVVGRANGSFTGMSFGDWDVFASKLDASGMVLWTKRWGSDLADAALKVLIDPAGNIYVLGETYGVLPGAATSGECDAFLTKLATDGTPLWTRQWGSSGNDTALSGALTADGNAVLVAGGGGGTISGGTGMGSAFLGKWNADGQRLWLELWAPFGSARAVAVRADGAIFVGGNSTGAVDGAANAGMTDVFVTKWTESGAARQRVWSRQYGTPAEDRLNDIALHEGAIYLGGYTEGSFPGFTVRGSSDNFLLRLLD